MCVSGILLQDVPTAVGDLLCLVQRVAVRSGHNTPKAKQRTGGVSVHSQDSEVRSTAVGEETR